MYNSLHDLGHLNLCLCANFLKMQLILSVTEPVVPHVPCFRFFNCNVVVGEVFCSVVYFDRSWRSRWPRWSRQQRRLQFSYSTRTWYPAEVESNTPILLLLESWSLQPFGRKLPQFIPRLSEQRGFRKYYEWLQSLLSTSSK